MEQRNVQDAFKYNRARKNVIIGGAVILICITALSCVSSYTIYNEGFADMPFIFQQALSLFAVVVVEGAFVWLVYGFTRAFSSAFERLISLVGLGFLVVVMLINLITHFMMAKGYQLSEFQQSWVAWGAVTVFIAVLIIVLLITLGDPVIRLIRLELRFLGKQQEKILEAKTDALDSDKIQAAMAERADYEATARMEDAAAKVAAEREALAELERHGAPPPFWKDPLFWAGAGGGLGLAFAGALGAAVQPDLRYVALLDVPAFGWAAWIALKWVGGTEGQVRADRRRRVIDEWEKKVAVQFEKDAGDVREAVKALGVSKAADLKEALGRVADADAVVAEWRKRLADWEASPDARGAKAERSPGHS